MSAQGFCRHEVIHCRGGCRVRCSTATRNFDASSLKYAGAGEFCADEGEDDLHFRTQVGWPPADYERLLRGGRLLIKVALASWIIEIVTVAEALQDGLNVSCELQCLK